jgi:nitroreductase
MTPKPPDFTRHLAAEELLTTTISVSKRLDLHRPVNLALLREVLTVALQAPSGSNRQGWHVVVVTDPAKRAVIGDYSSRAARHLGVASLRFLHLCTMRIAAYSGGVNEPVLPLRERNRLSAWSAIHEASAQMALDVGLAGATVGAIADAAGVSTRSFFNYFPSKEDAMLGLRACTLSEESLNRFRALDASLLRRTVGLMNDVLRSMVPEGGRSQLRRALIRAYPELRARIVQHTTEAEALTLSIVAEELANNPTPVGQAGHATPDETARALVMLAGAITRFTYTREPFPLASTSDALNRAIDSFQALIEDAS